MRRIISERLVSPRLKAYTILPGGNDGIGPAQGILTQLWTTLCVLSEIVRHTLVTLTLIASVHLTAAFAQWISYITNTSVLDVPLLTLPMVGRVELKQLLLTIDAVFVILLAVEASRDISRVYRNARQHDQ